MQHTRLTRLPFPQEILFDQFRTSMTAGTNAWLEEQLRLTLVELGKRPDASRIAEARALTLEQLDRAKVFVLTAEAVDVVIATASRLKDVWTLGPIELPACPMWVEFEGALVVEREQRLRALWFLPEAISGQTKPDGSFSVIRLSTEAIAAQADDRLVYVASEASWKRVHPSGCPYQTRCSLAQSRFQKGVGLLLHSRMDALAAVDADCQCYGDGQQWAQFLWVLTQMLRAEGAKHTVVDRRLQIRSTKQHKSSFEKGQDREKASWNATHPVYVRVSLEYRFHVRRNQESSGVALVYDVSERHLTQVVGHWRLLVPAPEKPWRGEKPRIIWVRGHERYVHGKRKVRYHVTP